MDLHLITMFADAKANWLHNIGLSSASCEKEHLMCFIFKILRVFFPPTPLAVPRPSNQDLVLQAATLPASVFSRVQEHSHLCCFPPLNSE